MRFALLATCVAAIVAVPLAVHASGPQMTGAEFLSAVRCVASEASDPAAEYQLNTEARHQAPETVAQARAIALQAVNGGAGGDAVSIDSELGCVHVASIARARTGRVVEFKRRA